MKAICTHKCMVNGRIIYKGDVVDAPEKAIAEMPDSLKPMNDQEVKITVAARPMTKEQLQIKLSQLGVPFRIKDSLEDLQKKLDEVNTADRPGVG